MKTLDQLAIEHGTDKATVFTRTYAKAKGYAPHYEHLLGHLRNEPINLIEIGVGGGESIRMWMDFFPKAHVFGVDIVAKTNIWNTEGDAIERYTFTEGDQSSYDFWEKFLYVNGTDWSVLVDDGGHFSNQIIMTHTCMWPHIKPGGFYCIEDLACSYSSIFLPEGARNPIEMLKSTVDTVMQSDSIEQIHFSKELAIIQKSH